MNQLKTPIHASPFTLSAYNPMECLYVDIIEKLTKDATGNSFVVVLIDAFSRYVELFPVPKIDQYTIAHVLLQHLGRFGAFDRLVSDRGSVFVNKVITEFLKLVGSQHKLTVAYSKEENGIVERANKEVMRHIRNIVFDKSVLKHWSVYTPLVQRIINSSIHSVTGVAPAKIIYGDSIDLNNGLFTEYTKGDNQGEKLSKWVADALTTQHSAMDAAKRSSEQHDSVRMSQYPTKRTEFAVGTYVLMEHLNDKLRRGPKSKLLPFLKGPLRVESSTGSHYTVQDLVTKRNRTVHVSRLREFQIDTTADDPLKYALKDDGISYAVERVADIKGNPKGPKTKLEFLVY